MSKWVLPDALLIAENRQRRFVAHSKTSPRLAQTL
jgi:hypothetical protein